MPRREIENYFLDAQAIVALIHNYGFDTNVTDRDIEKLLNECLDDVTNREYYPRGYENPKVDIRASSVLEYILNKYHIPYNKIKDGLFLIVWFYEYGKTELNEIYDSFQSFFKG